MSGFPKWIQAVEKVPRGQAVVGALLVAMTASGLVSAIFSNRGEKPKTLSADWVAAERDYGKFQGLNPITGKSYK